jgi:signal transduction histidine kinase/CheY-like chemotaxis protein
MRNLTRPAEMIWPSRSSTPPIRGALDALGGVWEDGHMKGKEERGEVLLVEEHGRALLKALPDLVFHLGCDGTYLDVFSTRPEDLFIPREELIGRTVLETLPSPVGESCMAAIGELSEEVEVASFDYQRPVGGQSRWFEGRVARCAGDSVICVVRDFTDQRVAEMALQEANEALRERAAQLQRLSRELTLVEERERRRLSSVLHDELQQLLVGAKCHIAMLMQRVGEGAARESAERASSALSEAIRQSQSLTVALCPPVLQEGDLVQALEWVTQNMSQTHGLQVGFELVEGRCEGIPESLRIVVFHAVRELLLNVVKHADTPEASVEVTCRPGLGIEVAVLDGGKGFAEEKATHSPCGGFGLFAIRERLAPFGGTLEVSAREGGGSRVVLSVPAQEAAEVVSELQPISSDGAQGERSLPTSDVAAVDDAESTGGIRVLIVDDHEVVRQGISQLLAQRPDIRVVGEAANGAEAFTRVSELRPDVVLMDVNMPVCNGIEATRRIHEAYPQVAVIGLSMYHEAHRVREMTNAGAVAYLSKSEAAASVVATILSAVDR